MPKRALPGGKPDVEPKDLALVRELLTEQMPKARAMAAADKKGVAMFYMASGDYLGVFVVRLNAEVKERLILSRILDVVDNPGGPNEVSTRVAVHREGRSGT